jgi:predicted house-cleaning noncanonical NTP pyrophosphatase (MazG superfamily)
MSPLTPAPKGYPIKLVRDNTADIVNPSAEPGELWYEALPFDFEAWQRQLNLKLGEEVTEYLTDGGVDELRDVLAVVQSLCVNVHGITLSDLIDRMEQDPRGGFLHGVVMYGRHKECDK